MNAAAGAPGQDRLSRPMAGRQLGRYEILTQLASGGMASVYIARAQGVAGFERLVAIKVLHPHLAYEQEFISMFLDEARLAARIRHMNVVPTLDISDSPGDGYFLVMEYIEGDHLGALLGRAAKKGDRLPRPFVCRVMIDALHGLAAAHRLADENGRPLKLVHRDVSPHNILVGTDGIGRLTDFGVAKADVRMASTRAGQFKGKLSYMAPEQASSSETDQRSDLFSAGIILWESLTGRRLFKGDSNAATLNRLLNDPVQKPSTVWPELEPYDDVVMKALSRNPEQRFQTAEEFAEAVDAAAGIDGVAKTRDVAEVVRALNADKLQDERDRVRDAIELLGRAEFGTSGIPMPREGVVPTNDTDLDDEGMSRVHGTGSGRLSGDDSEVDRANRGSDALKWAVMLLAIVVFVYSGLLVWQLIQPTPPPPLPFVEEAVVPEPGPAPESSQEPATSPPPEVTPEPVESEPKAAPERKNSSASAKSRRRAARLRRQSAAKRAASEAKSEGQKDRAAPVAPVEPVDIDIQNPYRN